MANYSDIKKLGEVRDRFIKEREEILVSKASSLQKKLIKIVIDNIIDQLDRIEGGGNIKNTLANVQAIAKLDRLYDKFLREDMMQVIKSYTQDLSGIGTLNERYFALSADTDVKPIADRMRDSLNKRLGIDGSKLSEGGFLDSFVKDTRIRNDIKNRLLRGITAGEGINTLKKSVTELTDGKKDVDGKFQQYFKTYLTDTLHQYNNETSKGYADAFKLRCAVYAGTEIKTTRAFCQDRINKVFTREEIAKFGTSRDTYGGYTDKTDGEFNGKPIDYDPFRDLGGYNCRHSWNWVSDTIAIRMRPELKEILQ